VPARHAKYEKEYGFDEFELQVGAIKPGDRVVIVDDLLATGGSFSGAVALVKQVFSCRCLLLLVWPVLFLPFASTSRTRAFSSTGLQAGGEVLECLALVELKDLKGRQALMPINVHALIQY
jgi:adenine/guanine phosphoribosyltransferase-like PRPP-binding protein